MTLNIPKSSQKRVVIAGGGFAGLSLVKKLSKQGFQVVLIDRNNYHQFQPLLYQVATSALNAGEIAFPYRKLFRKKKNVFFRMAEVTAVDAESKTLFTDHGEIRYDYLILATGSTTNYFGMENIERNALAMKDLGEALAIRNSVLYNIETAVELKDCNLRRAMLNIVIVGGGPTGIELAGAFAEMKKNIMPKDYPEYRSDDIHIYLLEGAAKLIGNMSEKTSVQALEQLRKMGVKVELNKAVTDYVDNHVILKDGSRIPTYNLIWTSGIKVEMPAGLEKCERVKGGRIITDEYFAIKGYRDIYVVGDASIQISEQYPNGHPQLARAAIEQANHLAKNLTRMQKGEAVQPFGFVEFPILATVGRNHAFAEYKKFRMGGFFAWIAWAFIHLISILGVKNKLNVMWDWFWNYITFDLPARVILRPRRKTTGEAITSPEDNTFQRY